MYIIVMFGTAQAVLITVVSLFQEGPYIEAFHFIHLQGTVHGQILLQKWSKCSMSHLNRYIPQMLRYINHLKELS